jgi:hypothetical protein
MRGRFPAKGKFKKVPGGVEVAPDNGAIGENVGAFVERLFSGFATTGARLRRTVDEGIDFDDGATSFFRFVGEHRMKSPRRGCQDFSVESCLGLTAFSGHSLGGQYFYSEFGASCNQVRGGLVKEVFSLIGYFPV